ncbi:MAG: PAS domain-containing protein [Pseudomonadota bacterium]|jgi:hypothetical protein|nr:PAS domain-containing protein [Pseudomonadota bacterium]
MTKQNVFKGVTDSQQKLIEYWCSLRDSHGYVRRDSMDPGRFCAMLASISIVEFNEEGAGRFRIAGSRLRQIFGMEARGRRIEDVLGEHGEAYCLGLAAALERRGPVGGKIRQEDGRIHAWLRLPLAGPDGRLTQVLCHDELLRAQPKQGQPKPATRELTSGQNRAAA